MEAKTRKHDMTQGSEWKLILLFAIPVMLGNLLQQLYSAADGIIVGRFIGEAALSSVGMTNGVTFLCTAFAMGLGVGASVVVSQYFGAGKKDEIPVVIDTGLVLAVGVGAVVMLLAIFGGRTFLSSVMKAPDHLLDDATIYLQIYAAAMIFTFMYNVIAAILRGMGDSKATLYFLIVSAVTNVILDLLFVAVFKWGVIGAAVATSISQTLCALVSLLYLRKRFKPVKGHRFDKKACKMILRMGVPSAIQQSIVSFGNIAMQRLVNGFGQVSIAAYTAGNRLDLFMFVPVMGMSTSLSAFTGQNIGAGNMDRVKRGLRATLVLSCSMAIFISILLKIFGSPVVAMFGLSGDSLARGVEQVNCVTWWFWIFSLYMAIGGAFQGAGDVMTQSAITLLTLFVRVALGYIGVGIGILDYEAAWVTMPIGWGVALTVSIIRYFTGGWKKKAIVGKLAENKSKGE